MKPVMDANECAEYLGLTLWTFRRLVRQGIIPGSRVGGRWRFLRGSIDEWLRRGGTEGAVIRGTGAGEPGATFAGVGSVVPGIND